MEKGIDKSLLQALSYGSLTELPEKDDNVNVWTRAIVLLVKRDCSKNYGCAVKGDNGTIHIVRDFGCSSIYKIEEVYPYEFLSSDSMPYFKKNTKEDRIQWLSHYGVEADDSKTLKELDLMVLNQAIKNSLKRH